MPDSLAKKIILSGHQVVSNENDHEVEFTPHSHVALFGVVLSGEYELVIEGKSELFSVGNLCRVPEGALQFARQSANDKNIVIFMRRASSSRRHRA